MDNQQERIDFNGRESVPDIKQDRIFRDYMLNILITSGLSGACEGTLARMMIQSCHYLKVMGFTISYLYLLYGISLLFSINVSGLLAPRIRARVKNKMGFHYFSYLPTRAAIARASQNRQDYTTVGDSSLAAYRLLLVGVSEFLNESKRC